MRPTRPGDVIALPTARGLAFAQVTHRDRLFGTLIRVLEPLLSEAPSDLKPLVDSPERFYTFYPVGSALKRGLAQLVGNVPVPTDAETFPLLRRRGQIRTDGAVADWWLWDGERRWRVGDLTPDQLGLSIAEVVNDTLLRDRIEQDWSPPLVK
jgi:hypothetical protein